MLPAVEIEIKPVLLKTVYRTEIYADGRIVSQTFGGVTTNYSTRKKVADLAVRLRERGFFELNKQAVEKEILAAAVAAGRGLAVCDGADVALTLRSEFKTNTFEWGEPQLYSDSFPSAHGLRTFVDCIDMVYEAVPDK
jgi:hypothetical protein